MKNESKALASEMHRQGYNCAQCVLASLSDKIGLDRDTALRIASGLGSGVGGSGEICGALNALAMAEGMLHGTSPADKISSSKSVRGLVDSFKDANGGRVACRDLKGKPDIRPCGELIAQCVELFTERHSE